MNLEKSFEMSLLNDFYGKLLTPNKQQILLEYYNDNMTLAEIAENYGVTRQAVLDSLKKSEKQLKNFEDNLGLVSKYNSQKQIVERLIAKNKEGHITKNEFEDALKALLNVWEGS
ncbi:MAG: sigma factor-like helix-turn-helix DNA-binding protein [Clostridia bacterium]|nr:sigma factor-like helix-turn-helix DNA-binding protein [Clostridia bacterium]